MPETLIFDGELEIRARGGGRTLSGNFPYNKMATVRDRGRVRKERFRSRAFGWQIREFQKVQADLIEAIAEAFEDAEKISALKAQLVD